MKTLFLFFLLIYLNISLVRAQSAGVIIGKDMVVKSQADTEFKVYKTEMQWKKELSPELYYVAREKGTERAYSGKYYDFHKKGTYYCACCGLPLFESASKFESGTGWPSFFLPFNKYNITDQTDNSLGVLRNEVTCTKCGAHLGHVFDDGPAPTHLRYCINSICLEFKEK